MNSDITFCTGKSCPMKGNCFRYTAKAYGKRDFFSEAPYEKTSGSCDRFLDNNEQVKKLAYELYLQAGKPQGQSLHFWTNAEKMIAEKS